MRILQECHDSRLAGRFGRHNLKAAALVRRLAYWPGQTRRVAAYVWSCCDARLQVGPDRVGPARFLGPVAALAAETPIRHIVHAGPDSEPPGPGASRGGPAGPGLASSGLGRGGAVASPVPGPGSTILYYSRCPDHRRLGVQWQLRRGRRISVPSQPPCPVQLCSASESPAARRGRHGGLRRPSLRPGRGLVRLSLGTARVLLKLGASA